ncbi:MAG: hypothetical protein Q8L00_05665 [Deltaproteobacteria bacterium]|nr:hypothetical protein [Deltaproteobacteria bacterium]
MVKKICAILLMIVFIIMTSSLIATAKKTGPPNEVIISKVPVEIDHKGEDDVGRKLVYQIKQMIHKSQSLTITHDKNQPRLKVSIITIDENNNNSELSHNSTVYSLVISYPWAFYEDILYHSVGICGKKRIKEVSENIVANIDEQNEIYYKLIIIPDIKQLFKELLDVRNEIRKLQQKSWWEKLWE